MVVCRDVESGREQQEIVSIKVFSQVLGLLVPVH